MRPAPQLVRAASAAAVVAVVVAGIALRLVTRSELWLDEALSVSISSLPVGDLLDALRHDGHPPLYYLLLHGWMEVFGDGNEAVRSLSAVCSVATLPVLWLAARSAGDRHHRRASSSPTAPSR